ncbi:MAG: virulence-associated protein E [Lachnospiraceae bacterium]|nr:virulence-associated protein E [Lachnospiraceae bacterium]
MQNNRLLRISTAGSRKAVHWPESTILWSEFVEKLRTPVRGTETLEEYLKLPKPRQDELKDVGGFVGGTFFHGRRKAAYVSGRDLITLDLDTIHAGQTEDILKRVSGLGCAAMVYSTRKHAGYAPRLRVVVPLDRTAAADEYEPAARKLASFLGMEFCDPTTFEASRLMYWASCCADGQYVYEVWDGGFCSVDGLLGLYGDWRDIWQWPRTPGENAVERRRLTKQEDPRKKQNTVGAFCRTYSITQAMERFLPGIYEPTAMDGRYTYLGGSTTGGAVVYDGDLFLYSHHATDPCSGLLVNAFDLVRLHKFGDLDLEAKEGTPPGRMPSYTAMSRLAAEDPEAAARMTRERLEAARAAFQAPVAGNPATETEAEDMDWVGQLSRDGNGRIQKTINNAVIVLENDTLLKGKIAMDDFASCGVVLGRVPWNVQEGRRRWEDVDDSSYYQYMELFYGITGREKLDNALLIVSSRNRINDVERYLKGLSWDGTHRVDTLLQEYLGAEDNAYVRAVMRKSLCAAVARAVASGSGVKYDYMPILAGPQGIGKSTFLAVLGKDWFSDSLVTFEGKDAAELIQGTWINEVGELTAMTRQETNTVKQFLGKKDDIYRAAYGKRAQRYIRRCVFFGTSNEHEFLKDATGERRFWPVDVGVRPARKSVWKELPEEVDQVWAEVYLYWSLGESLYMPKELEALAAEAQEQHKEGSVKEGLVRDFLEKQVPKDWESMDIQKRRMYWNGNLKLSDEEVAPREKVCAAEIWVECLRSDLKYMTRKDSLEINGILSGTKGWARNKSKRRYGPYGILAGFERSRT